MKMAVSTMWIRNNMLRFDQHERKLTDAELKVQRSLDSLTIPEWYLKKRSNPPKILNNTPLDRRPSPWKNPDWKRTSVTNLSGSTASVTPPSESPKIISEPKNSSTDTYKIQRRQKSPDSEQQKSPSATKKTTNARVPDVRPQRDISKTFPKMSPSRKVHNINLVLARGPPSNLSDPKLEQKVADSSNSRSPNSGRMSFAREESEDIERSSRTPTQQRKEPETNNAASPSTRFLTSRRKSTELENLVRSKKPPKEKSVVRGIIEALAEKVNDRSSLPRQNKVLGVYQNFVRTMVDALESGNLSNLNGNVQESLASTNSTIRNEDDQGSASESDRKSCATSMSPKDTDSSSDCDLRSPSLESDGSRRTFDFDGSLDTGKASEDSVYWIPVSRCKLPRSSSLLSMMSRLSTKTVPSPCVSPIRSDSENENSQTPWGTTYKRARALSRDLFRIDETIVIDSGYSDRSDRSDSWAVGRSTTDSNWSEDTRYESGADVGTYRIRKTCRRRSGIGATFRVSE